MLAVLVLAMSVSGQICNPDLNNPDSLSSECNFRGVCASDPLIGDSCVCCDSTESSNICGAIVLGTWTDTICSSVISYTGARLFYHVEGNEVTCDYNWPVPSVPSLLSQTVSLIEEDYTGKLETLPCKTCTADDPCNLYDSGIVVGFQTDFNTFYDSACLDANVQCEANVDYGTTAYLKFKDAMNYEMQELFIARLQTLANSNEVNGLNWSATTITSMNIQIEMLTIKIVDTEKQVMRRRSSHESGLTQQPPTIPTLIPTASPTQTPTQSPTGTPSETPTESPTRLTEKELTLQPTDSPTQTPTQSPSSTPTETPTERPTKLTEREPTHQPSTRPTLIPTDSPSEGPTTTPTQAPSSTPTETPSEYPTVTPTNTPTVPTARPTSSPTEVCIQHAVWTEALAEELCPDTSNRAYEATLCPEYDNPDNQRRLEHALANQLYASCTHACVYDYDSFNTTRPHAFRWTGDCYNVATGYYCIDDEVDIMEQVHEQAERLCKVDLEEIECIERVTWTKDVAESNCPEYSNGDKGWGTAKVCPEQERRYDGFYDRADELYQASFNLSLANHIFYSCTAKCVYDIDDNGIAYQYKGDCWEMQTKYACFTSYTREYLWSLEYKDDRLCPAEPVATPAPTPFECVPRQLNWNQEIALSTCPYVYMGKTDKSANATVCEGYEDYQFRLDRSLANRMFHDCEAWCVYDIFKNGHEAFLWSSSGQCYRPVTSGLCIDTLYEGRLEMVDFAENILCASATGEPTEAPTCIEQAEWSEELMDEYCSIDDTGLTYKHHQQAIGRAAVPCAGFEDQEADLLKSLAVQMYHDCSAWCVYDYYSNANLAWKWSNSGKCYKLTSSGSCFYDYSARENNTDWLEMKERVKHFCTYSPTVSPTGCVPYYDWTYERAEELCDSTTDYGSANKSHGVQVCSDEQSVGKQVSLEKSLANDFDTSCSAWCVFDYDTIVNNTLANSTVNGGFKWRSSLLCWQWVTDGVCFDSDEFEEVSQRALGLCVLS